MTQQQQQPGADQAISYMRHQASKGLESLAQLMERTEADWARCLEGMSETQASFKPQGEWSAKEVLAHVLETSRSVNRQVSQMASGTAPEWQPGRAGSTGSSRSDADIGSLRSALGSLFGETVSLVRSLKDGPELDQSFDHPFFGSLTLKEWLAFQRIHAMDHIQQIDKIKADPAYPKG